MGEGCALSNKGCRKLKINTDMNVPKKLLTMKAPRCRTLGVLSSFYADNHFNMYCIQCTSKYG